MPRSPATRRVLATACGVLLTACSRSDPPATASVAAPPPAAATPATPDAPAPAHGVAWQVASSDAQVDAAFAQARRDARPLFVYWGAKWCPPCNQVKATLFNRQDFIARSKAFVPVYIDGDSPGAQRLGARFRVSGYPTMVLFSSQGSELTRLPGEVDPARYLEVLTLGMNARTPVKTVLAQALAGADGLTPDDWRLLAFYAWDTDQQQIAPRDGVAPLLRRLAAACPAEPADTARRLQLQALAATGGTATDGTATDAASGGNAGASPAARQALLRLLADASAVRAQTDVLVNAAAIVRAASPTGGAPRRELVAAFDTALQRLQNDPTLSRADRLTAVDARIDLLRIDAPRATPGSPAAAAPVPAALQAELRDMAARDDREITDGYERQAVVTAAADTLAHAGLGADADALLQANLPKSHSPYYLMSMLSRLAKERGDTAGALDWASRAFDASEGPATRLQWGASLVDTLVTLAPVDEARIETAVVRLLGEAGAAPDAFDGRSGRSLQRIGTSLQRWNTAGTHAAAIARLQRRLDAVCAALPPGGPDRSSCTQLLTPPARAKSA